MAWSNGLAEWIEGDTAYLSVVFSWRLRDAYQRAAWYNAEGYKVKVGGPAVWANHQYANILKEFGEVGGTADALQHHNPLATLASRGCPVGCYFCVVPKMDGKTFTFLPDFTPRPILCDNNLSALPVEYQAFIIEKYKRFGVELQDANSGFEPLTFDEGVYRRWKEINRGVWRFAYDESKEGADVERVARMLKDEPASKKRVYVLIGNEPKEDCLRRVNQVIEWGCEPHCKPLMALNTLEKKPRVLHDWTERELMNMARWANRWIWRSVKYEDYVVGYRQPNDYTNQLTLAI
jgi:hypothetical protein